MKYPSRHLDSTICARGESDSYPAASPVSLLSKSVKLLGVIRISDIWCAAPFCTGIEPFGGAHEQLVLHHCSHVVQYLDVERDGREKSQREEKKDMCV